MPTFDETVKAMNTALVRFWGLNMNDVNPYYETIKRLQHDAGQEDLPTVAEKWALEFGDDIGLRRVDGV